jgi:[protein-PII] uridylyltransferase
MPAVLLELDARLRARRDVRAFFEAKFREQKRRHERFQEAAYNLEPNIKESPGGLRDLQMVIWLARAAGFGTSWKAHRRPRPHHAAEAAAIGVNERVLQDLRIRLHYLANRREDRLVFDHQIEIARQLKLKAKSMAPSDLLMRRYYLAAKAIWRFNQILVANLFDRVTPKSERKTKKLDEDFQVTNVLLEIREERLFERRPGMILEAVPPPAGPPRHRGARAQDAAGTVPARCRGSAATSARVPRTGAASWRSCAATASRGRCARMSRYGVLGKYLPAFGRIVGQMQHDLFHVYTVDEHILMVIRNLRRFPHPALRSRIPVPVAADAGVRPAGGAVHRRSSSTTSPRGAAATTRTWAWRTRRASAARTAW